MFRSYRYALPLFFGSLALVSFMLYMLARGGEDSTPYALPTLAVLPTLEPTVIPAPTTASNTTPPQPLPIAMERGNEERLPDVAQVDFNLAEDTTIPAPSRTSETVPNRTLIQFDDAAAQAAYAEQLQAIGATVTRIDGIDALVIDFPAALPVEQIPALPNSAVTEPDYFVTAQHDALNAITINDPLANQQWALHTIAAAEAWHHIPANAVPLTVAVVDSGICADHPDLVGRVLTGKDWVDGDTDPVDTFGHGCAVSGIIAANMNDGIGVAGIALNTNILPLRVLDAQGIGQYSDVAAAIVFAADAGAQIINVSLGGAYPSSILENAVDYAASKGSKVIASAGNGGQPGALYPARYDSVIAVGAVGSDLQRTAFSNYGESVDVYAPGSDIIAPSGSDYDTFSGTSFAAPHVSAVAALEMLTGGQLSLGGVVRYGGSLIVVDGPPSTQPGNTYTGTLFLMYGDPQDKTQQHEGFVYLHGDDGIKRELLMSMGEAFPLRNRRVEVSGSIVANADLAAMTLTTEALQVATVRPLENDEANAQFVGTIRWATLLCKFSNVPDEPHIPSWYSQLFSDTEPGIDHYWQQMSYGVANIGDSDSQIFGWVEMSGNWSSYMSGSSPLLGKMAQDCANAATSQLNLLAYDGLNFMFNADIGCCAWGGGVYITAEGVQNVPYNATWMPPWSQNFGVMGHEMGHGFGLPHSSGPYNQTYDSLWDIMSGGSYLYYSGFDGLTDMWIGGGTIGHHIDMLEWIPSNQRVVFNPGDGETITLERVRLPQSASNALLAVIPIPGTNEWYTVEARMFDSTKTNTVEGYDSYLYGLASFTSGYFRPTPGAVLMHRVNMARSDRDAQVVDADGDGDPNDDGAMWLPGEEFYDSAKNICVKVLNLSSATSFDVRIESGGSGGVLALDTPINNATTTTGTPDFVWLPVSGETNYVFQIATNAAFTANLNTFNIISSTAYTPIDPLNNGTYYWRVRGANGTSCSWSAANKLVINNSAPSPIYYTIDTPTLTWSIVEYAVGYEVEVSRAANFSGAKFTYDINDPLQPQITTDPLGEGVWYWRVRAEKSGGLFGNWTAAQSFTVDAD